MLFRSVCVLLSFVSTPWFCIHSMVYVSRLNVCVCVCVCALPPGQPCPFLLLVLQDQLGELQAALLASMLAEEAFSLGSSQDLHSPLSWAEGLALIHSCPQEEQLLALLGPAAPTRLEDRAAPSPAQVWRNSLWVCVCVCSSPPHHPALMRWLSPAGGKAGQCGPLTDHPLQQ